MVLLLGATAGPGLAAAAIRYTTPSDEGERGRIVPAVELAVLGLTPGIARIAAFDNQGSLQALIPLVAWIVLVVGGLRFAVRPLLRVATRAGVQRDMVVGAMEAERARLAADIHDDALQDLTMLVRRFDAAGDAEGAAAARHIADRLRAICGDLRLPILDDLGAGPALEWLVERVERLAGGEVRLERGDDVRPPADVELAFFRVAQEALANAVKHGSPPIVVRYRTTPSGASLSVDDAGAGIDAVAARGAADHGRFGMLNMSQRAEHIGAILDVRRWPRGGTHVALEWRSP
jgi:signal transduction histidine kinase